MQPKFDLKENLLIIKIEYYTDKRNAAPMHMLNLPQLLWIQIYKP